MTFTSILTEIRGAISGDSNGTRWTDSVLRDFAFAGEVEIVDRHPEAQYGSRVQNSDPTLLTANGDSFTIAERWRNALIHYICFRVFAEDSDDAGNRDLAAYHFKLFKEAMGE